MQRIVQPRKWSNIRTCKTSRLIWPTRFGKRSARLIALNRPDISLAVKAITGHWLIGTHAARLSVPHKNRSCKDLKEEESVTHLLWHCLKLGRSRLKLFVSAELVDVSDITKISPRDLVTFIRKTGRDS